VAWCGNWTFLVGASVALTLVPLLFPDGRWLGRGWRLVGWAAALTITVGAVAQSLPAGPISGSGGRIDNPIAAPPALTDLLGTIASLAFPVVAILGLLSIASLFVRFRRADRVERAQLKWFLSAVSAFLGMLAFAFFFQVDGRQVDQLFLVAVAFLATIPIATGVAILRYRLFDIDRIISRTIGWLAVTGILGAVFAGGVLFAQAVLEPVTGGSTIGVAAATLVAAALFAPVRSRVQRTVDRRFNRARYDAERTAAGFAARLRDDVDLARVVGDLSGTAQQTLAPASMSVWIKGGPAR